MPQMDFILEMFALDNPEEWSFSRNTDNIPFYEKMGAWEKILTADTFHQKKLWPKGKPVIPTGAFTNGR